MKVKQSTEEYIQITNNKKPKDIIVFIRLPLISAYFPPNHFIRDYSLLHGSLDAKKNKPYIINTVIQVNN